MAEKSKKNPESEPVTLIEFIDKIISLSRQTASEEIPQNIVVSLSDLKNLLSIFGIGFISDAQLIKLFQFYLNENRAEVVDLNVKKNGDFCFPKLRIYLKEMPKFRFLEMGKISIPLNGITKDMIE